jgi:hypothetical protein
MSGTQYDYNPQLYKTGETGPSWRYNSILNSSFASADITIYPPCRGIYVGTAGDVAVRPPGGRFESANAGEGPTDAQVNDIWVFKNVPAGTTLAVMAVGSTAPQGAPTETPPHKILCCCIRNL